MTRDWRFISASISSGYSNPQPRARAPALRSCPTCDFVMQALVGGSDCGPSNPLAQLSKQYHSDRSNQHVSRTPAHLQAPWLTPFNPTGSLRPPSRAIRIRTRLRKHSSLIRTQADREIARPRSSAARANRQAPL